MTKSREAFRTISEVSDWLETPAHVLRFWESKFTQVKPVKRAGGRRYYRPEDMALLGGIKVLLHEQGMTIKGVQKMLREKGTRHVAALGPQPLSEGGEWIDLEPGDEALPLAGPEAAEPVDDTPALPEVVEVPARAAMPRPAPAPRPVRSTAPRPGILAALVGADPARMARAAAQIRPLADRLAALRARMAVE